MFWVGKESQPGRPQTETATLPGKHGDGDRILPQVGVGHAGIAPVACAGATGQDKPKPYEVSRRERRGSKPA